MYPYSIHLCHSLEHQTWLSIPGNMAIYRQEMGHIAIWHHGSRYWLRPFYPGSHPWWQWRMVDALSDLCDNPTSLLFDKYRDYRRQQLVKHLLADADMDHKIIAVEDVIYAAHAQENKLRTPTLKHWDLTLTSCLWRLSRKLMAVLLNLLECQWEL